LSSGIGKYQGKIDEPQFHGIADNGIKECISDNGIIMVQKGPAVNITQPKEPPKRAIKQLRAAYDASVPPGDDPNSLPSPAPLEIAPQAGLFMVGSHASKNKGIPFRIYL